MFIDYMVVHFFSVPLCITGIWLQQKSFSAGELGMCRQILSQNPYHQLTARGKGRGLRRPSTLVLIHFRPITVTAGRFTNSDRKSEWTATYVTNTMQNETTQQHVSSMLHIQLLAHSTYHDYTVFRKKTSTIVFLHNF